MARALLLKPRRGSDSLGVAIVRRGPVPRSRANDEHIAQTLVRGAEVTVAVLGEAVGSPLLIELPPGRPYSFLRKYVLRPRRAPLADRALAERVRREAREIARLLGVAWAARLDFIHDARDARLYFLECDAAPLIGRGSAFSDSLLAAGIGRAEQLRRLVA